jgi:transcriptional regulator with XRE-family HTH domain
MAEKTGQELAVELLQKELRERRCSQAQLAKILGLGSQGTIGDVLSGRRAAGAAVLHALARRYPEHMARLIGASHHRTAKPGGGTESAGVPRDPVVASMIRAVEAYMALHPEANRTYLTEVMGWVMDAHVLDDEPHEPEWWFARLDATIKARNKRLGTTTQPDE